MEGSGDAGDHLPSSEPAQVVGCLAGGVVAAEEGGDCLPEITVGEAGEDVSEAAGRRQNRHHPRVAEAQTRGMQAVLGGRRPGHVLEGNHVGAGAASEASASYPEGALGAWCFSP
jgi:hypothetical protein